MYTKEINTVSYKWSHFIFRQNDEATDVCRVQLPGDDLGRVLCLQQPWPILPCHGLPVHLKNLLCSPFKYWLRLDVHLMATPEENFSRDLKRGRGWEAEWTVMARNSWDFICSHDFQVGYLATCQFPSITQPNIWWFLEILNHILYLSVTTDCWK